MEHEPDLTELMFFIDNILPDVRAALWQDLNNVSAKSKPHKCNMFVAATLTDEEVDRFRLRYPTVPTAVNIVIAGQEYPPPAGYRDTIPELSRRLLPESHGETFCWQGLVGQHFEVAKDVILAQFPEMRVYDLGQAAAMTADYHPERVRLFTDHKHIVRSVPTSG